MVTMTSTELTRTASSTVKLVIFDMDDVLCRYDLAARLDYLAALSGRSAEEIRAAIWDSGFEARSDAGEIDAETYFAGFAARLQCPFSRADWTAARRHAMTVEPAMLALVKEVAENAEVALLTNNGLLLKAVIGDLFPELPVLFGSRLFVSAEFATRKPDPLVYRRLTDRVGVEPGEALMIDDKPRNIAGARSAGLQGHVFRDEAGLRTHLIETGVLRR